MSGSYLSLKIKTVVERFAKKSEPDAVRVDRNALRTTLIQCEFEVREMQRLLNTNGEFGCHRVRQPSSRY